MSISSQIDALSHERALSLLRSLPPALLTNVLGDAPAPRATSCSHTALISYASTLASVPPPSARGFNLSRFRVRHIALHVAYLGHDFHGFASQDAGGNGDFIGGDEATRPPRKRQRDEGGGGGSALPSASAASAGAAAASLLTVEALVFGALSKACFVEDRASAGYTRCGRTDKGVSACAQVLSLRVRSKALRRDPPPSWSAAGVDAGRCSSAISDWGAIEGEDAAVPAPCDGAKQGEGQDGEDVLPLGAPPRFWTRAHGVANTGEAFPPPHAELDYAVVLNNILPPEVRVLGWADVPESFSARVTASVRSYRYYFPARDLDLPAMRLAGRRLTGTHDFRNVCKIDLAQMQNFSREVLSIRVVPVEGGVGGCSTGARPTALGCTSISADAVKEELVRTGTTHVGLGAGVSLERLLAPDLAPAVDAVDAAAAEGSGSGLVYLEVVGRAFLYHQVRCIAALLFLVGRRLESPESVAALLDVAAVPARPLYPMASEAPLILHHCGYGGERAGDERAAVEDGAGAVPDAMAHPLGPDAMGDVTTAAGRKPTRFENVFPGADLGGEGFYASPAALKRVTGELEANWGALSVKAALVRGVLDAVYALPVDAGAAYALAGLPSPGGRGVIRWGDAAALLGSRAGIAAGVTTPLVDPADRDYTVLFGGGQKAAANVAARLAARAGGAGEAGDAGAAALLRPAGYTPLLHRDTSKAVADRWRDLDPEARADILARHPTNAARLQRQVGGESPAK